MNRPHWLHYALAGITLAALLVSVWIAWRTRTMAGVTVPVMPARMGWRA